MRCRFIQGFIVGYQNFISEAEAENLTGCSSVTLARFVEAGYLRIEVDTDGLRLFSKSELENVFGLAKFTSPEEAPVYHGEVLEAPPEVDDDLPTPTDAPPEPAGSQPHRSAAHNIPAIASLEREVERLKNIAHLQEKVLELKDREISGLARERDWLRERIEKLEEKSERDQMILASISETNRGLLTSLENRRSPVRAALQWLGLVPEPEKSSKSQLHSAIEVSKTP